MERGSVRWNMTNHPPVRAGVVEDFESLREAFIAAGEALEGIAPGSREKSLALTNLEQALMWGIASLARNQ